MNSENFTAKQPSSDDLASGWEKLANYGKNNTNTNEAEPINEKLMSPDEKKELLRFDVLSALSSEEYLRLWRTLNPFYVTHITRQGIRDHNGMFYHSAGMGDFHDGFKEIAKDGKLFSPSIVRYGVDINGNIDESKVQDLLKETVFDKYDNIAMSEVDGVVESLPVNSSLGAAETWSDKTAIHFAQHTVLNEIYGGENSNEAFFVFPTDVIASQSLFGGHMHGNLNTAQTNEERKWNDIFVWTKDGSIPIDTGFTFLPKNTLVDKETGSIYACQKSTHDGQELLTVEKDEAKIAKFKDWVKNTDFNDENFNFNQQSRDLSKILGVDEEEAQYIISDNLYTFKDFCSSHDLGNLWFIPDEQRDAMDDTAKEDYATRKFLELRLLDLKKAENTIRAEEYWEEYFRAHPEEKPKHLVYYDGDPTEAVNNFLIENGVMETPHNSRGDFEQKITGPGDTVARDGEMLGFDDHYIDEPGEDSRLHKGQKEYNALAKRLIIEHYQK